MASLTSTVEAAAWTYRVFRVIVAVGGLLGGNAFELISNYTRLCFCRAGDEYVGQAERTGGQRVAVVSGEALAE